MRIETNIVYGLYSGLALLLDIYRPTQSNGYGIIHISGSGWSAPLGLDAKPLKASPHAADLGSNYAHESIVRRRRCFGCCTLADGRLSAALVEDH